MPPRSLLSSFVFAGVTAFFLFSAPQNANAQTLIDFLWGGSKEWGGGKQTVAFDPKYTPGQIIVSFGDRRLYHIIAKGQATSYPIAVPREKSRWQGTTKVSAKRENPSWRPTREMLSENPKLPTWVPGGHPMNPLGVRALYLGTSAYRIHGTDAPWTIGKAVSQGCIRMFNKDVLDLYPKIPVGMRVTVTWERFKTQMVASSDSDDSNHSSSPFQSAAFQKSGLRRHSNRQLPPEPRSAVEEAQTAAVLLEGREPAPLIEGAPMRMPAVIEAPVRRPKITPETAPKAAKAEPEKAEAEMAKVEPAKAETKPEPKKAEKAKSDTAKAEKAKLAKVEDKPTKTAARVEEPAKTPTPTAATGAASAAKAARKAAAAAAKAAQAAREAAELAKKAAASAKKATTSAADPAKTGDAAEPKKSAAL